MFVEQLNAARLQPMCIRRGMEEMGFEFYVPKVVDISACRVCCLRTCRRKRDCVSALPAGTPIVLHLYIQDTFPSVRLAMVLQTLCGCTADTVPFECVWSHRTRQELRLSNLLQPAGGAGASPSFYSRV